MPPWAEAWKYEPYLSLSWELTALAEDEKELEKREGDPAAAKMLRSAERNTPGGVTRTQNITRMSLMKRQAPKLCIPSSEHIFNVRSRDATLNDRLEKALEVLRVSAILLFSLAQKSRSCFKYVRTVHQKRKVVVKGSGDSPNAQTEQAARRNSFRRRGGSFGFQHASRCLAQDQVTRVHSSFSGLQ
jgi:hypothetical protein